MKRFLPAATCLVLVSVSVLALPASAAPPSYTIVDLGPAGVDSYAWGVNATPVAVGQAQVAGGYEAYRWQGGTTTPLGSLNDSHDSIARAINASGLVVGGSSDGLGGSHATSWSGTTIADLGTFVGNYSAAFGVNDAGQIVGEGCVTLTCFTHALLWDGGSPVDLGTLSGGDSSHARGVNEDGLIIGDSEITSGGDSHAVIWQGTSGITDLGTLPLDEYSNGVAINDAGHATGRSLGRPGGNQFAFFWDGSSMSELPMLPGGTFLEAAAINESDQIVGRGDRFGDQTAFLWERSTGETIDLNALLPSGSGWQLAQATGINDAGDIVGFGYLAGHLRGFLLAPSTDPAPTDIVVGIVAGGGTISTDSGAPGTTPADPVATTVTTPVGGVVSIREGVADVSLPPGFAILGQQVRIRAPQATVADPLRIVFVFDASIIPIGQDATTIEIFRDTEPAAACTGSTEADPDPCVVDRADLPDGSVQITVLTSHASAWSGATATTPPPFPFTGFFRPLAKQPPALNQVKTRSAVRVKFSLGGDRGLAIFDPGFPQTRRIDCASLAPIGSPAATRGRLTYHPAKSRYRYAWKTPAQLAGTCQQFTLELTDGTQHVVNIRFTA